MFIYKLIMNYTCTEGGVGSTFDYLINDRKFAKEEFEQMCKEAFENCHDEQSIYVVKMKLKEKYGFKELTVETTFEFEEKFD